MVTECDQITDPSFFLVGLGRSGTSLLREIINASEKCWLTRECHWFPYQFLGQEVYKMKYAGGHNAGKIERHWDNGFRMFNRHLFQKTGIWGIQTIGVKNAEYVLHLASAYPKAKFIYLIRDPRDVFLSMVRTGIGVFSSQFSKAYNHVMDLADKHPGSVCMVRYEDIVSKPEHTVKNVCATIGCDYSLDMLYPLTQQISHNQTPAISENDFNRGDVNPDLSLVQRWKKQLLNEDLLDLNFLYPALKCCDYEVYSESPIQLNIESRGFVSGKLIGASLSHDGGCDVKSGFHSIDISSVGVVGIEISNGFEDIIRISLEGHGSFIRSEVYDNTFLLRLVPDAPTDIIDKPLVYTWPLFKTKMMPRPGQRMAIYSAGGSTKAFLEKMKPALNHEYKLVCIIDKYQRGELAGLNIVSIDDAMKEEIDYILVTSIAHHDEIHKDLVRNGMNTPEDFCMICCADQKITS